MSDHLPVVAMTTVNVFHVEEEDDAQVAIANMLRGAIEENTAEALEHAMGRAADADIDADLLEMGHAALMAVKCARRAGEDMITRPPARYVPPMLRRRGIGDESARKSGSGHNASDCS